jgi:hypothetical protein
MHGAIVAGRRRRAAVSSDESACIEVFKLQRTSTPKKQPLSILGSTQGKARFFNARIG